MVIAGLLENSIGVVPLAWRYTILILAALLGVVGLYHLFISIAASCIPIEA